MEMAPVGCNSTAPFSMARVLDMNLASAGVCSIAAVAVVVVLEFELVLEFAAAGCVGGGDAVGCSFGGSLLTPPFSCIVESL